MLSSYRYSFQGQEKDPETGKEAFQLRLWDGRIGRWLTTDPYRQYASPYVGMGNNPVNGTDPDGGKFFDWVREKGSSLFYWDSNINSPSEASAKGLIYGGVTKADASASFLNSRSGWDKFFGIGGKHTFDENSYFNAEILPLAYKLMNTANESYSAYHKLSYSEKQELIDNDDVFRVFDPVNFNDKKLQAGSWLDKKIILGGKEIVADFYLINSIKEQNYSDHVRFRFKGQENANMTLIRGNGIGKTRFGINFSNFYRKEIGVFWIVLKNSKDFHFVSNHITK